MAFPESSNGAAAATSLARWQPSRLRRVAASMAFPIIYMVNRPALAWFGRACLDLALRFNGIAINYPGPLGLTLGEEKFLGRFLARSETGVLLDVGANGGSYARVMRSLCPDARIIAFEPHPVTFAKLQTNTATHAIEAIGEAVGAAPGELILYDFASADGSTQASLSRSAIALYESGVITHAVTCTTIDKFMVERGLERIALLKIDCEGHDLGVLQDAAKAIAKRAIAAIQFEIIPANVATRVLVKDFFEALPGYRLHRLCLNGELLPLPKYDVKTSEIFVTHNLVALPA